MPDTRTLSILEFAIRFKAGLKWRPHDDPRPREVAALVAAELEREGYVLRMKPPREGHSTP